MLTDRIVDNAWYHRTVQDLFAETCRTRSALPAIFYRDSVITYGDLKADVDRTTAALLELGIGPGDVVSVLPSPTPDFTVTYFAVLQTGAIFNALNLLWGTAELSGVLTRNDPVAIITVGEHGGRDYPALLTKAIGDLQQDGPVVSSERLPRLRHLLQHAPDGVVVDGFRDLGALSAAAVVDTAAIDALVAGSTPTDVQWICQTSGTTGLSKSALWNHRAPLATANYFVRGLDVTEEDRYLNLSPFFHNSGICCTMTMAMAYCGLPVVLADKFDPAEAVRLCAEHEATVTFGFDAHWQGMHRSPDFDASRFTIRRAMFAGEPKTYDLVRRMCGPEAYLSNLYAQTENGPLVSLGDFSCMEERLTKYTNGRPLPGVEVVIKDIDTGRRLPQGEAGEICYRSPFMFVGYYRQDEAYRAAFDDEGLLRSGDFGSFDGGYITFLGRLGGVVKSGGENVSTVKVSTLLLERFADEFDDVQTLGVEDDYWGHKVVTFVRTRPGVRLRDRDSLRADCKGAMADYEVPREFLSWDGPWPVSPEGKIDLKVLRARVADA